MLLFQTALPLELPQVKPKRNDEGKGLGVQFKGPLGPGGKGSVPELKSAAAGCPMHLGKDSPSLAPAKGSQKPASPLPAAADHLEEELDLLLNLDAPGNAGDDLLPDQIPQALESEKDGEAVAQEEKGMVFVLFPKHLLVSGIVTRERLFSPHLYICPLVSDTDLALSTDIYFHAHISASPVLTFLSLDTPVSKSYCLPDCNVKPGRRTEPVLCKKAAEYSKPSAVEQQDFN